MTQTAQPDEGPPYTSAVTEVSASSEHSFRHWAVVWSSFGFALLQSICSALVALSGLRLVVAFSSLASALGARIPLGLHADWVRIPMLLLAMAGSLSNLYAIRRVRRLRSRPAAQWRMQPVPSAKLRSENIQILLALATLVLILVEEFLHIYLHHVL